MRDVVKSPARVFFWRNRALPVCRDFILPVCRAFVLSVCRAFILSVCRVFILSVCRAFILSVGETSYCLSKGLHTASRRDFILPVVGNVWSGAGTPERAFACEKLPHQRERMEQGGDPRAGICLRSSNCVPVRIGSKNAYATNASTSPRRWIPCGNTFPSRAACTSPRMGIPCGNTFPQGRREALFRSYIFLSAAARRPRKVLNSFV